MERRKGETVVLPLESRKGPERAPGSFLGSGADFPLFLLSQKISVTKARLQGSFCGVLTQLDLVPFFYFFSLRWRASIFCLSFRGGNR